MIHIPDSLITRILQKKCILFLGAGATKESGGALGSELGKYIYNQIGDIGIDFKENLGKYTQLLVNAGYRDEIERLVRKRFSSLQPSSSFCNIAHIPWKAIYTTNYDDLVEKAYSKQRFYNYEVKSSLNVDQNIGDVDIPIYKINGDINLPYQPTKPLVITLNDLRNNKKNNEKMISQLMKDMNDTFIFLGYSFQDENEIVTDILDAFQKNERWESVKEKYVILPHISEDVKLDLESYKINYIQGTADDFFEYIGRKSKDNFIVKLNALRKNYASNDFFKDLEPQTLQYISECFDVYDSSELYPSDGKYFYRGGRPNWGIIKEQFDISRDIKIQKADKHEEFSTTDSLFMLIQELLQKNKLQKIKLEGAAVSGKTTALYRCAFDLITNGTLSLEDIMIVSVDGLTGFGDAIHAVFPQAEIQRCIVHQIRYSTKFISYKDLKPFMADLKLVYKADTEDLALTALEDLEEKWGKKYPASIGSWRNNWTQLSTYFKYPSEIRKLIYTTNSIENFNRQLRKVTKSKTIFPTDDALFKMLYLAMMDATKKWTGKAWDWGLTLDQLCIYFGDRIQPEDID